MPSTFSWMDHSDAEQRRVVEAIDRFKENEARDELGLGTIRDAFADALFPGTSTIQTRARYFLFVPWVYAELERRRVSAREVAQAARKGETAIIAALKATSPDDRGIIGARAGDSVKRLPSSVYWLGLSTWKIRLFDAPIATYHRTFDRFHGRDVVRDDDREPIDAAGRRMWHAGLPPAPKGFPKDTTLALRPEESEYLSVRIQTAVPGSLLARLVRTSRGADCEFPWEHIAGGTWSREHQEIVAHGRLLAETMHGAAWLYNLLLAEERAKSGGDDARELVEHYRKALSDWAAELRARSSAIDGWDHEAFWRFVFTRARVPLSTKDFVESWIRLRTWERADGGADNEAGRRLVARREQDLKRGRARLGNARALELWGGAAGTLRLDYRWGTAQRLLADIFDGFGGKEGTDARAS